MKKKSILLSLLTVATVFISAKTIADDSQLPTPEQPQTLIYRCSYTDGGTNNEPPKAIYAVTTPTESDPKPVTDLAAIANIYLSYDAQDYITVQIQTSPTDASESPKLMAEGQFSTLAGFSLAAIRDGAKVGTLACGYVDEKDFSN